MKQIFPRAVEIAARTFKDRPKVVGEVVCALVNGGGERSLSEVQRYILQDCRADIAEIEAKREADRVRKQKQRKGASK